jgi:hypothetical protein
VLLAVVALTTAVTAVAAPPALANAITVTAPAGTATYHSGDALTVAWRLEAPVKGGYFCVYIKDTGGKVQQSVSVNARTSLSYTTTVTLDLAAGSTYYVTVKYRPNRNADFTMTADSPGTFTIPALPFPFQTMAYSTSGESVVKGSAHTFRFWILHPDPAVAIVSGVIEFRSARTYTMVATRTITDILPGDWIINSTWDETPPPNAAGIVCDLPVGAYLWTVRVTTSTGASAGGDDGYLSVTRR